MYKIKEKPEDFIVKEIPDYKLEENGRFAYFWMKKTNYNTIDAVKHIAIRLNLSLKQIGYAGTKDKIAITKQVISIPSSKKDKAKNLKLKDIGLSYIGDGNSPISLGNLKGNEFVITVRNIKTKRVKSKEKIVNFFGPQRFSKNNAEIGRFLIKKDFKKATDLIDQRSVREHLESNPADFIGALRNIPLKTRKIYIHAYQSLLWNKTAEIYLKNNNENIKIPLIGFRTQIESLDIDLKEAILDILNKEEITKRDFILPQIKELSAEGAERELFIEIKNLEIRINLSNKNEKGLKVQKKLQREKTAVVSFFLPKGSYATVVIEELFS